MVAFRQWLRSGHERDYARPAHALYRDLLGPVVDAGWLPPGRAVVIVPDRALERLPFQALVTRPVTGGGRVAFRDLAYLVQRNPVRYLTAASDLLLPERPTAPARVLGVAPAVAVSGLAGAVTEVRSLERIFPAGGVAIAVGDDAFEERITGRLDLKTFSILHFATHGRASALAYQYSGVVLGTADESTTDGVLHGYEVLNLGVAPALVVLSACSSGRDVADRGASGVGWGRAFLEAGAAALVLSTWSVQDVIAAELMGDFYKRLLQGAVAEVALATACRKMIAQHRDHRGNPRYWAPFMVVGTAVRFSR